MNIIEFVSLICLGSFGAGFLGALTGLGGGVVIVPMLTLLFGVDIRLAIGASLISVIATSSGAAAAYVREGFSNIRIGMFLEIATTIGAIVGALMHPKLSTGLLAIIFGIILIYSALISSRPKPDRISGNPDKIATRLRMHGTFPALDGIKEYQVRNVPQGFGLMFIAGTISGLLGIGSGAMKVLAMDQVMRIPFKVSTTTSNFMIGVTAAASAGIYLAEGYIRPGLTMPVMLGVLTGSLVGARVLAKTKTSKLRIVFATVVFILALEMIYNGIVGNI